MERFQCFDYYSPPILEGCFCFVLHINGYTDSLLGAPTVILNKVTCGYITNEWATPFFSTQFCYWAAVHLVPVNCLLSILNNMKLAEYELKLIFVITHGAKYPKQPVYRISGSWKRLKCCIYGYLRTMILGLSGIIKPPKSQNPIRISSYPLQILSILIFSAVSIFIGFWLTGLLKIHS